MRRFGSDYDYTQVSRNIGKSVTNGFLEGAIDYVLDDATIIFDDSYLNESTFGKIIVNKEVDPSSTISTTSPYFEKNSSMITIDSKAFTLLYVGPFDECYWETVAKYRETMNIRGFVGTFYMHNYLVLDDVKGTKSEKTAVGLISILDELKDEKVVLSRLTQLYVSPSHRGMQIGVFLWNYFKNRHRGIKKEVESPSESFIHLREGGHL
jgi:hypothetical protein